MPIPIIYHQYIFISHLHWQNVYFQISVDTNIYTWYGIPTGTGVCPLNKQEWNEQVPIWDKETCRFVEDGGVRHWIYKIEGYWKHNEP